MPGTRQPKADRELITTTASVTLTYFDIGKTICNLGASGSVTITLPAVASVPGDLAGGDIRVLSCADQDLVVAGTAGELITLNDLAANSVALSTSGEKLGGSLTATFVGTKWHISFGTEETQTVTPAT